MKTQPREVTKAYERCKDGRSALAKLDARCMECTEDKAGIVWERWLLPNGRSAILFATPHWWDVFVPVSPENSVSATVAALGVAAQGNEQQVAE